MQEPGPNPFHEHMPRQALALAGWLLFWLALEAGLRAHGMQGPRQLGVLLAVLAAFGAIARLGCPGPAFRLLTSVRFAVTQGLFLAAAVLGAALAGPGILRGLWFCALLALLALSMLTVSWKRRPYDLARTGFLLVHVAPALILLGALWGRCAGVRARAVLRVGSATDTFQRIGEPGSWHLPGRLRLEVEPGERTTLVLQDPQHRELARGWAGVPLRGGGYAFHSLPEPSGGWAVQVVRAPGLWLVQSGCASLLLGCAWMFYLKPVLKRRQSRP